MANAGGVRAGAAYVEIFAKDGQFQQGMARIQGRLKSLGSSMRSAGAGMVGAGMAIVSPMLAAAQQFASVGGQLFEMSQRTGVAAESLSVLKFAAEQTGTDLAGLETGLRKMQKTVFAAGQGSKEAADALGMVGLSAVDLQGLSADEQMARIADGLMAIQDPGTRAAVAMAIFGKSGTSLLPMLEGGSAGLARFAQEAQRLGLVMDGETAAKADALDDAIAALGTSMRMAFIQVGSAIAPLLTEIASRLSSAAAAMGTFIRENQQLVNTALAVGAGLVAFGGAVYAIGFVLGGASRALGLFASAVKLLPALFTPVGAGLAILAGGVTLGVVAARQLSPAFREETDAIMAAIMRLDFATAWQIMNLNFAIALVEMGAAADQTLRQVQGFFEATGAFIGDKLIEGLDRFMGLFGADIITLQSSFEKLGIYFRAAFDWKWAATSMSAALDEAEKRENKARARAPTADARADARAANRQEAADQRQAEMDQAQAGWEATANELRDDLRRAKETPTEAPPGSPQAGPAPGQPGTPPGGEQPPAATTAASGGGRTVGGFFSSGEGLGIGPDLAEPAKATADNTKRTADATEAMAAQAGVGGGSAVGAAPSVAAMAGGPPPGAGSAVGGTSAAAAAPGAAAQAREGLEVVQAIRSMADRLSSGLEAVVAEIRSHAKLTEAGNGLLSKIVDNTGRSGAVFS